MKSLFQLTVVVLLMTALACGKKDGHQGHSGHNMSTDGGPNQVLFSQAMDIHDEVMPLTEDLYNITKDLKAQLKETTVESEKLDLEKRIHHLDSVNHMMMDWMRNFKPLPDSTNEETARVYYENGLEKVKAVKEAMLAAMEREKNVK